jgi:hypothetical protein
MERLSWGLSGDEIDSIANDTHRRDNRATI